jgi:Peptidase A4 family
MRSVLRYGSVVCSCALGCSGTGPAGTSNAGGSGSAPVGSRPAMGIAGGATASVVRTLRKEESTRVTIQTLPSAACELSSAGVPDTMRLFSDDRGLLTFYGSLGADGAAQRATITCSDRGGTRDVQTVAFRGGEADSSQLLQEEADRESLERRPHPGATVLPALSPDEAAQLSVEDIQNRGYPPRKTSDPASAEYTHWLELVSKPVTVLAPHVMADTGVQNGPASPLNTNIWSGLMLTGSAGYGWAFAGWRIPSVEPSPFPSSLMSMWVGLDGNGTPDLVQDGTMQLTYQLGSADFYSYYSWIEYYPSPPIAMVLPVQPLDNIEVWTWMSDAGPPSRSNIVNGGYAWFYLFDINEGLTSGYLNIKTPDGLPPFTGTSAEWIVERPTVNNSVSNLANYSVTQIFNPEAKDFSGNLHTGYSDPYTLITMVNPDDGVTLDTDTFGDHGNELNFWWAAYQ